MTPLASVWQHRVGSPPWGTCQPEGHEGHGIGVGVGAHEQGGQSPASDPQAGQLQPPAVALPLAVHTPLPLPSSWQQVPGESWAGAYQPGGHAFTQLDEPTLPMLLLPAEELPATPPDAEDEVAEQPPDPSRGQHERGSGYVVAPLLQGANGELESVTHAEGSLGPAVQQTLGCAQPAAQALAAPLTAFGSTSCAWPVALPDDPPPKESVFPVHALSTSAVAPTTVRDARVIGRKRVMAASEGRVGGGRQVAPPEHDEWPAREMFVSFGSETSARRPDRGSVWGGGVRGEEAARELARFAVVSEQTQGVNPLSRGVLGEGPRRIEVVVRIEERERPRRVAAPQRGMGVTQQRNLRVERRRGRRRRGLCGGRFDGDLLRRHLRHDLSDCLRWRRDGR